MCRKTLVGLIIGNIPGARERNNPDIDWAPALTRTQTKQVGVTSKLKLILRMATNTKWYAVTCYRNKPILFCFDSCLTSR